MKKLLVVLAVLAVAVPSMAATTVGCAVSGTPVATGANFNVTYSYDLAGSFPRAFALDISTNLGTISGVTAAKTGESTSVAKGFGIFPGTIAIDSTGSVTSYGSPVAPQSDLPSGTQAGIGNAAVTVELGSLYSGTDAKPANSGTILTVSIACATSASARTATITIVPNTARGGLVLEDATSVGAFTNTCNIVIPAGVTPECFASLTPAIYNRWVSSGKPNCWCPPASVTGLAVGGTGYQCVGDADQAKTSITNYRVYSNDLTLIQTKWKSKVGDAGYNACADIDHAATSITNYGVYSNDLTRVQGMWKKTDAQLNTILGVGTTGGYCGQTTVPAAYK